MDRHSGGGPPPHLRGRPVSGLEAAHANEYFDHFLNAATLKNILGYHRSMCELLHLKPNVFSHFYPKLRANLNSWRAKAVWKKFDARASHKCYGKGKSCSGTRVLIIGGGPCGLRTAIESQLLGAKVVVVEKRDRLSRNNVLHLWPFVIEDLRMLGAKKFFGKFCAGAIDHISIRQLQCILLKVALLLGVEVHTEVSFEGLLEPSATEKTGWRADIKPENHPVSQYEFDVIIGADGKRNTLQGFKRKEFRGKLAIAITANFINKKSEAEARVEEISGVAFIFNQKFFKNLQEETRIDLENIVYYKDDTHYFVMTAKKASLLEKGVIIQDLSDTEKLLAPENVDRDALQNYARQAADFSTNYQLPQLDFAVNHYGQPDVAMFDFTSMYAAEYASKVVERHGVRLLKILVGDSLLEPFWPTGSGCARGFLSSLDAAWAIRSYCSGQMTPLDVLAERESIYRLLAQTTPDNLNKDWKAYTLDPATRYPNLNKSVVTPHQTVCLYDTDNPDSIDKMKRASLEAASRLEHVPKKRRRGIVDNEVLVSWLSEQLREHKDIQVTDIKSAFRNGKILCAIIHHYRPDLLDYGAIKDIEPAKCNQLAMDILEKDLGLPPFMTGEEITNTEDYLAMATYLTQVYDTFRGEIPHIKHPKLNVTKKGLSKLPQYVPCPTIKSRFPPTFLKNIGVKSSGDEATAKKGTTADKLKLLLKDFTERKLHSETARDDMMLVEKSKIPRKKTPRRLNDGKNASKPLKTLSEKTFLVTYIKSLKSIEKRKHANHELKGDFFDLTYRDAKRNKSMKTNGKSRTSLGENTTANKMNSNKDKKLKKTKSRNVSVSVNMSEILKKNKLKLKTSKLSIIPENTEEKLNKDASLESLKVTNQMEIKNETGGNGLQKNTIKLFRCETFVQDSFDCLALPIVPPLKEPDNLAIMEVPVKKAFSNEEQIINVPDTKVIKTIIPPGNKNFSKIFGLNNTSMLKIIRNHLLAKKQRLSLVLSKPVIISKPDSPKIEIMQTNSVVSKSCHSGKSYNSSSQQSINIEVIHKSSSDRITCQNVEYESSRNIVKIISKAVISKQKIQGSLSNKLTSSRHKISGCLTSERSAHSNRRTRKADIRIKTVEEMFQNKTKIFKDNESSHLGSTRNSCNSCLDKIMFPDLNNVRRFRTKKSRSLSIKKKSPLTPVDAQIIKSLGSSAKNTSNLKKACPKTSERNKVFQQKQKFSLQSALIPSVLSGKLITNVIPPPSKNIANMEFYDDDDSISPQIYTRVQKWISQHDFKLDQTRKDPERETLVTCDMPSDITSVTRAHAKKKGEYDDVRVEERTDVVKCQSPVSSSQEDFAELVKSLRDGKAIPMKENKSAVKPATKYSYYNMKSVSAPPANFSVIVEGEESELPESNKRSEFSFKSVKTTNHQPSIPNSQPSRPSSRHKRHAEVAVPKPCSIDRKQRKRRTLERIGPSVIYSRWFLPLFETVAVGIMLLMFDMYVNPEEYIERPTTFLDYIWT